MPENEIGVPVGEYGPFTGSGELPPELEAGFMLDEEGALDDQFIPAEERADVHDIGDDLFDESGLPEDLPSSPEDEDLPIDDDLIATIGSIAAKAEQSGHKKHTSPNRKPSDGRSKEDQDLVNLYLIDVGKHPLLTKDDEVRLAKTIEAGNAARERLDGEAKLLPAEKRQLKREARQGEEANRQFINSNLRLVVSIAKKYQSSGLPLLDLVQEGNLGLIHAVDKFDYTKGFKFSTYATWWIRQAIQRGIANTGRTIRLPVHAADTYNAIQKARARLELNLGRPASMSELATEMDMPEVKVNQVLQYAAQPVSLSEPLREGSTAVLGDIIEDRTAASTFELAAQALLPAEIEKILASLDEREREIITLRFGIVDGEERTLQEVAEHFQLTRERIRQTEARAMSKLRHPTADTGARNLFNS